MKAAIDAMGDNEKITYKMNKKKIMESKHKNFMENGKDWISSTENQVNNIFHLCFE